MEPLRPALSLGSRGIGRGRPEACPLSLPPHHIRQIGLLREDDLALWGGFEDRIVRCSLVQSARLVRADCLF